MDRNEFERAMMGIRDAIPDHVLGRLKEVHDEFEYGCVAAGEGQWCCVEVLLGLPGDKPVW